MQLDTSGNGDIEVGAFAFQKPVPSAPSTAVDTAKQDAFDLSSIDNTRVVNGSNADISPLHIVEEEIGAPDSLPLTLPPMPTPPLSSKEPPNNEAEAKKVSESVSVVAAAEPLPLATHKTSAKSPEQKESTSVLLLSSNPQGASRGCLKFMPPATTTVEHHQKVVAGELASRSFKINQKNERMRALGTRLHAKARILGDHTADVDQWKDLVDTCEDETLRRWVESRAGYAMSTTKKFTMKYVAEPTETLIGTEGFDGLVFADQLKSSTAVQDLLNKMADPNARDAEFGFTASHAMAWSASLTSWFPESWHMDRLRILRRAGADNRVAVDLYGRTSLMLALEKNNVQFVKALLRVEIGETWALHQLRRIPMFSADGDLIKAFLHTPTESEFLNRIEKHEIDVKSLLTQCAARPIFRHPANMPSGIHWAAFHGNAFTIQVLAHLGLPVNIKIENEGEPTIQTPLQIACAEGNLEAVDMLLRCNADPLEHNSVGLSALDIAKTYNMATDQMWRLLTTTKYPPFKQTLWGRQLCWDSPGALAKLLEHNAIQVQSIEDLCAWYLGLAIEPQDRVAGFWKVVCDRGELGTFG